MPYIKQYERSMFDEDISELAAKIRNQSTANSNELRLARPGFMNYCITKLILEVYGKDVRYGDYNEMIGMLTCCMHELYRRGCAPYEDSKIRSEGDVYPPDSSLKK